MFPFPCAVCINLLVYIAGLHCYFISNEGEVYLNFLKILSDQSAPLNNYLLALNWLVFYHRIKDAITMK